MSGRRNSLLLAVSCGACLALGTSSAALAQTVVYPEDGIEGVRAAVYGGGTVLLKATNRDGVAQDFDFGKLEYDMAYPPSDSRSRSDMSNHGIAVSGPVVIQGETVSDRMTTIVGGYLPFSMGLLGPTLDGNVTIEGIHFEDSGWASIYINGTTDQSTVTIRNNRFTGELYDLLGGTDRPVWNAATDWDPAGSTIIMLDNDLQDVSSRYNDKKKVQAWLHAWESLYLNSSAQYVLTDSGYVFQGGWWFAAPVLTVARGGVKGPIAITDNYLDLEEDSDLPSEFERVFYHNDGIYCVGPEGDYTVSRNVIRNGSADGILLIDATSTVTVEGNDIDFGLLGSYRSRSPVTSTEGILAVYRYFMTTLPPKGGDLIIRDNRVSTAPTSRDARGITVAGAGVYNTSWNSALVEHNSIQISNGFSAITVADMGDDLILRRCGVAEVLRNTVEGSASFGILVGNATPFLTTGNTFEENELSAFEAGVAQIYLSGDAVGNTLYDNRLGGAGEAIIVCNGDDNEFVKQSLVGSRTGTTAYGIEVLGDRNDFVDINLQGLTTTMACILDGGDGNTYTDVNPESCVP